MGLRHYLGIQLRLRAFYEGKNNVNHLLYVKTQLVKVVVIRPHPVASADSSNLGHASEGLFVYIPLRYVRGYLFGREFHGDIVKGNCP